MQIAPLMEAKLGENQGTNDLSLSFLCPITLCHPSFNSHARILQLNGCPCAHGSLDWQWRWVLRSPEWCWDLKPIGSTCQDLMHGPPAFGLWFLPCSSKPWLQHHQLQPKMFTKQQVSTGSHLHQNFMYIILIKVNSFQQSQLQTK